MGGELGPLAVSLGECKAFLRIEGDAEDGLLAGFIRSATALCEAFTGQWLIIRAAEQRLASETGWQRLMPAAPAGCGWRTRRSGRWCNCAPVWPPIGTVFPNRCGRGSSGSSPIFIRTATPPMPGRRRPPWWRCGGRGGGYV